MEGDRRRGGERQEERGGRRREGERRRTLPRYLMVKPRGGLRHLLIQPSRSASRCSSLPWISSTCSSIQPRKKVSRTASATRCGRHAGRACGAFSALKSAKIS